MLPEPVQRVADFLSAAGAEARLEEFVEQIPTVRDVATVTVREVVRSVHDNEQLVPALLPVGDGLLVAVKR